MGPVILYFRSLFETRSCNSEKMRSAVMGIV